MFLQLMLGETGKDREVALAEIAARQVQIDADEALFLFLVSQCHQGTLESQSIFAARFQLRIETTRSGITGYAAKNG